MYILLNTSSNIIGNLCKLYVYVRLGGTMKDKSYGTVECYLNLAFAVLERAVEDYYNSRRASNSDNIIFDINPMWFKLTGVDPEWFYKEVMKKGDEIHEKFCDD